MSPGKLNLYGLGDKGVDLVSTPLHADPNSWRQLQNAEFSNVEGLGGVKKRGGLLKLNTEALNSGASIQAIFNMPLSTDALVAPPTPWVYLPGSLLAVALWPTHSTSAALGSFQPLQALSAVPGGVVLACPQARLGTIGAANKLYFVSTGADPTIPTAPAVYVWDGAVLSAPHVFPTELDSDAGDIIQPDWVNDVWYDTSASLVYFVVAYEYQSGGTPGQFTRVYTYDGTTLTRKGDLLSGAKTSTPLSIALTTTGAAGSGATGRRWVAFSGKTSPFTGKVYILESGGTTWGVNLTQRSGFGATAITIFGDLPYLSSFGGFGLVANIRRRNIASGWGDQTIGVFVGPSDGAGVGFGQGIVFDAKIFVPFEDPATGESRIYVSSNGTAWTQDVDLKATYSVDPATRRLQGPVIFDGNLYWPVRGLTGSETTGMLLKRTTAGVWTQALANQAIFTIAAQQGA
jgi:hypothetical protein